MRVRRSFHCFMKLLSFVAVTCLLLSLCPRPAPAQCPAVLDAPVKPGDAFGATVDVFGDVVAVAALTDNESEEQVGVVYVFRRNGPNWLLEAEIAPDEDAFQSAFGTAVTVGPDFIAVGAPGDASSGLGTGAVYVYQYNGIDWLEWTRLTPPTPRGGEQFGASVTTDGTRIIVGAYADSRHGFAAGAAHIFRRDGDGWTHEARVDPADRKAGRNFGWSVALSGSRALIGAPFDDLNGFASGSAYLFRRTGQRWSQEEKIAPHDGNMFDFFGWSVALDQDRALMGAWMAESGIAIHGLAYLYEFNGKHWGLVQKLRAAGLPREDGDDEDEDNGANPQQDADDEAASPGAWFGNSVALSGDVAVITARRLLERDGHVLGMILLFRRTNGEWDLERTVRMGSGTDDFRFDTVAALHGPIAVGGSAWDGQKGLNAGAARVLTVEPGRPDCNKNGIPDECAIDVDDDGLMSCDNCPSVSNPEQMDGDRDGVGDACDNCPNVSNPLLPYRPGDSDLDCGLAMGLVNDAGFWQPDWDCDAVGDACDNCPFDWNPDQLNSDGDTMGDVCDPCPFDRQNDADDDGICGNEDRCPGFDDQDDPDGDFIPSGCDNCPFEFNPNQEDCNYDGKGDACAIAECEPGNPDCADCNNNGVPNQCVRTGWVAAKLLVSDATERQSTGTSVSIDGEFLVMGAPGDQSRGQFTGAAYVFRLVDGVWVEDTKLLAEDGQASARFGDTVAISGDWIAVGAPRRLEGGISSGVVYMFQRSVNGWHQTQKLLAADVGSNDLVGGSLGLKDDVLVVGADLADEAGQDSGAVHVFRLVSGQWIQEAKLVPASLAPADRFGFSVSTDGERILAGAVLADEPGIVRAGSAYVFRHSGTNWIEEARLVALDSEENARFGSKVAISQDRIVIGAFRNEGRVTNPPVNPGTLDQGAAYVFRMQAGNWFQEAKLEPLVPRPQAHFGNSVAVQGRYIAIGATGDRAVQPTGPISAGNVYVFYDNGVGWEQRARLSAPDPSTFGGFGVSLGISGPWLITGSNRKSDFGQSSGAGYLIPLDADCNKNGIPDQCDIASGFSEDLNGSRIPDECEITPLPDECADATLLYPNDPVVGEASLATRGRHDPVFCCHSSWPRSTAHATLWYRFLAPHTTARISTCDSLGSDTILGIFEPLNSTTRENACATLRLIGCADNAEGCGPSGTNARICVGDLTPGREYYVVVGSKQPKNPDDYVIELSAPCTPDGPTCAVGRAPAHITNDKQPPGP